MHIETLKIFCDLADLQSFSKTADKHLLSQSAVSQQLAQLELTYKCQLINRKKRPIQLTKAGWVLYNAAKDIIERYEQYKNELNTLKSSFKNRINVAAIYSIGMHTLPKYIKKFMVTYPDVNVHVEFLNAAKIYELIQTADLDIGLVAVPGKDKKISVYEFEAEPLVLACSPRHPLAGKNHIDIHQVGFERFIGFEKGVPTRTWIDEIFRRYDVTVRFVMEFDNIETVKRAVEINSGISVLPKTALFQEIENENIKALEFSNEKFIRPTGIIFRRGKIFSEPGKFFVDLLRGKK